jgi:hypothetical protein
VLGVSGCLRKAGSQCCGRGCLVVQVAIFVELSNSATPFMNLDLPSCDPVYIYRSRLCLGVGVRLRHFGLSKDQHIEIGVEHVSSVGFDPADVIEHTVCIRHLNCRCDLTCDFGCALNHSNNPNGCLAWIGPEGSEVLCFQALRTIRIDEELTIDYGPDYRLHGVSIRSL